MSQKKYKVKIAFEECKGCGRCVIACPKGTLELGTQLNSMGYASVKVVKDNCSGCGSCFYQCPEPSAITVIEITD